MNVSPPDDKTPADNHDDATVDDDFPLNDLLNNSAFAEAFEPVLKAIGLDDSSL